MQILTLDNEAFDLNNLPETLEEDVRFSVLDNSNPQDPDFFFMPLIFLESFNSPAMVLNIGGHEVTMPLDWSIAVGDPHTGCDVEVLPLTSINDRGFEALAYNPLSSFRLEFLPIEIVNFYNDVKWFFPKVKPGQLLSVPITSGEKPLCAFFIRELTRNQELIDLSQLI